MSDVSVRELDPDDLEHSRNLFLTPKECAKGHTIVDIEVLELKFHTGLREKLGVDSDFDYVTRVMWLDEEGNECARAQYFEGEHFGLGISGHKTFKIGSGPITDEISGVAAAAQTHIAGVFTAEIDAEGNAVRLLGRVSGAVAIKDSDYLNTILLPADQQSGYQKFVTLLNDATTAIGSAGGDAIEVGAGNDTVSAKAGDDIVYKWKTGSLTYNGGAGVDTLSFEPADGDVPQPTHRAVADLSEGTGISAFGGALKLKNIENIFGTKFADNLRGNASANVLDGGSGGADTIRGMGGDDLIGIDPNYDDSKPRKIIADGGAGHDTLSVLGIGVETLNRLDVLDQDRNTGTFRGGHFLNFEEIFASSDFSVTAKFEIRGGNSSELIRVGANADTIAGGGGNDTIEGGAGADRLFGGAGIDTLKSHSGGMTINLAANTAAGGEAQGDIIGGFENVVVDFGLNKLTGSGGANVLQGGGSDTINGGGGDDRIISGSNCKLLGGAGDDRITAGGGTIDGGAGNDVIAATGFSGDRITGGAGADKITGGSGQDTMSGGAGDDRFIFTSTIETGATRTLADVITGFAHNEDQIDLRQIDAKAGTDGNNIFSFIGSAVFKAEGQVRAVHAGGDTYVEINTFGKSGAEAIIKLTGLVALDGGDLLA
ncbi:hypothetical protein BH10PSE7_BH10PSE7_21920 [soil metagenome]